MSISLEGTSTPAWEALVMSNNAMFQSNGELRSGLASIRLSVGELETASRDLVEGNSLLMKRPSGGVYHTYHEMFKEKGFKVDDLEKEIDALPIQDGRDSFGGLQIQAYSGSVTKGFKDRVDSLQSISGGSVRDKRQKQQQRASRLQHFQYSMIQNFPYFPRRVNQELPFETFEVAVRVCIQQDDLFESSLPAVKNLQLLPRAIYNMPYVRGDPLSVADQGGVWNKILLLVFWRPSHKSSVQTMNVLNSIQEQYPHLIHILGVVEPIYERDVVAAGLEAPLNVVSDRGLFIARELGVQLSASSAGFPSILFCLPGFSYGQGVNSAGIGTSNECHKILYATDGRRALSRNTGRALAALVTAFGGNCPSPDLQASIIKCAKYIEGMPEWSMPFWASTEQWEALRSQPQLKAQEVSESFSVQDMQVSQQREWTQKNVLGHEISRDKSHFSSIVATNDIYRTLSVPILESPNPAAGNYGSGTAMLPSGEMKDGVDVTMSSNIDNREYHEGKRGVTSAIVDGIMYLLGGEEKPKNSARTIPHESPTRSVPPAASMDHQGVPEYAQRGMEYTQQQLHVLRQQRDHIMNLSARTASDGTSIDDDGLSKGQNGSKLEQKDIAKVSAGGMLVTTDTTELEPEVQAHYEIVQAMLQDCSSVPTDGRDTTLDPADMFYNMVQNDQRLLIKSSAAHTSTLASSSTFAGRRPQRKDYLNQYAAMWNLLKSMVHGDIECPCRAGHFLPMLHHRLVTHKDLRSSDKIRLGSHSGVGRRDVYAYEIQSRALSGGALEGLQKEELLRITDRFGGVDSLHAVEAWIKERAPGSSPEKSLSVSIDIEMMRSVATIHGVSGNSSTSKREGLGVSSPGGVLGSLAPRWDYVYCCLRVGLYDAAAKELARTVGNANASPGAGTGRKIGMLDSVARKGSGSYRSQTTAGREREKARESLRREMALMSNLHKVLEGLASRQTPTPVRNETHSGDSSGLRTPGASLSVTTGGNVLGTVGTEDIDLTSETIVAAVTGLREYYLSYRDTRHKIQAEQSYDRTHDTHTHNKGTVIEESMEVHKEAVILLVGFFELSTLCAAIRRVASADSCRAESELLWASMWQMHFSRRFLRLTVEGFLPSTPYEEELSCCVDPAGLYEEIMRWRPDFGGSGDALGTDEGSGMDNYTSFSMSPAASAYKHTYGLSNGNVATTPTFNGVSTIASVSMQDSGADTSKSVYALPFEHVRMLLCCQQFSAAVSFLYEAGEVVPAVHLACVLLYYGLLHSQEPLLRTVDASAGVLGLIPSDMSISGLLQSYAFPTVYPYVSLAYLLILVLPQNYPSLVYLRQPHILDINNNTAVIDPKKIAADSSAMVAIPPPILLEDISELSCALNELFDQMGGTASEDALIEMVQAMAELYFPIEGGSCGGRSVLVTVMNVIGQRTISVHRRLGEALFYFSLAESLSVGSQGSENGELFVTESFPEALISVLQQLTVQLQALVRPRDGSHGHANAQVQAQSTNTREKVREDARHLIDELFALAQEPNGVHDLPKANDVTESGGMTSSPLRSALIKANPSTIQQLGRLCCVLCNLETCASFLDLCWDIDQHSLAPSSTGEVLELDALTLVETRMKPLCWHFADPSKWNSMAAANRTTRDQENTSTTGAMAAQLLFSDIIPVPLLPLDDEQVQNVQSLLPLQTKSSLDIYKDLLGHCVSYLQRLVSYIRHGYGSSFAADTDRRTVEDLLRMKGRLESILTNFKI